VRSRLEREDGISFTEFSYMLLQSYDFLHLHDVTGCKLQTGGSDQWGNITAGVELTRRMRASAVYGMVYPLITKSDGTKFGKTESGSVWLSPQRTSPYRFYQFWLNTADKDVLSYLKLFTWRSADEIASLASALTERPEQREAQRLLARDMTALVHDATALSRAEQAAQALFGGDITGLSGAEIADIFSEVPSSETRRQILTAGTVSVLDLLVSSEIAKSKGEARRAVSEGGIYLNNQRVSDPAQGIGPQDILDGRFILLRKGKKTYHLVKVVD
jgi:tyrosyl-tRNA synthetase